MAEGALDIWIKFLSAIAAALLTAVLGNRLLHHWQQRNWLHQQQFSGLEKEYVALKYLTDSLLKDCGTRLQSMRGLVSALRRGNYDEELNSYRSVLLAWNGSIHAYYAQLTFQIKWQAAYDLEANIHEQFVEVGKMIERQIRLSRSGAPLSKKDLFYIDKSLNKIAANLIDFAKFLVRCTELRREEVYYGVKVEYKKTNLSKFSNFYLIKLLFLSNIDDFSIISPAHDVFSPLGRRL